MPDAGTGFRLTPRTLSMLAAAGIGTSVLAMIVVCFAGPSRGVAAMPPTGWWPPWWIPLHLTAPVVTFTLWLAAAAGLAGVAAGLVAVRRGARPPVRLLVAVALTLTAVFAVLPPAGSTDTLDYAVYGRMVAIGHDPYVMTPLQLRMTGDPVGIYAPQPWQTKHSVYGPLATIEEATAAILGGTSIARIVFWLKIWNALAFAVVVLALDRLVRGDPALRTRAHLLWSVNPLLLWTLVAGGHIDAMAAALGLLGVALVSPAAARYFGQRDGGQGRGQGQPGVLVCLAAGALVGAAADLKITYIMFGLGIAWVARRSPRMLIAAAGGALAVLVPSYLWFGPPALGVLVQRDASATGDNLYQLFHRHLSLTNPHLILVAAPLVVALAWLLLWRLPRGLPAWPVVRPALAFSLAWLLIWPYQRPWYDAMVFCLLAIYPATRLDWPVLARLGAATLYSMPGMPGFPHAAWLAMLTTADQMWTVPVIRLAALVAVVLLCLTGAWYSKRDDLAWVYAPSGQPADPANAGQVGRPDSRRPLQL